MNHQEIVDRYRKYEPFFGNWYIKRFIGAGGFANVFEISRKDFGEEYVSALKIITVSMSESEVKERRSQGMTMADIRGDLKNMVQETVREIKLMYKLRSCGNIMGYEDHAVLESEDGMNCDILIKLELLTSLSDYIISNDGRIEERMLLKLGVDICRALEMCQKHKIIHRDIKFENIFISLENGEFKLGDFGIARVVEAKNAGLSKKGTATYMAPEVYKGLPYDSSVDIYSLGMVLYRLLNNNRAPFTPAYPAPISLDTRDEAMMRRLSGEKLPKPNEMQSGRLVEIVLKACAYAPEERYTSPGAMRADMEAILYEKGELTEHDAYIRIFDVQKEPEEEAEYTGVTEVLKLRPEVKAEESAPKTPERVVVPQHTSSSAVFLDETRGGYAAESKQLQENAIQRKKKEGRKKWLVPGIVTAALLLFVMGSIVYYNAVLDGRAAMPEFLQKLHKQSGGDITPSYASRYMEYELNEDGAGYTLTGMGSCKETTIYIPETYKGLPVTVIGSRVFEGKLIEKVTIPDTITAISDNAFRSARMMHITIPDSVTDIGEDAFALCDSLKSIELPKNLTIIRAGTFEFCDSLESIVLPDTVTVIDNDAFAWCYDLKSINLPENLTSIGARAFEFCKSLEVIELPASLEEIAESAFKDSGLYKVYGASLEGFDFGASNVNVLRLLSQDGTKVYRRDPANTSVLPTKTPEPTKPPQQEGPEPTKAAVTEFSQGLKYGWITSNGKECYSVSGGACTDTHLVIPSERNGKPVIGVSPYGFCKDEDYSVDLVSILLPEGITSIGQGAFKYQKKLTSITFPDSLEYIEGEAFKYGKGFTEIVIPAGVKSMDLSAFYGCSNLKRVIFEETEGWSIVQYSIHGEPEKEPVDVTDAEAMAELLKNWDDSYVYLQR